MIMQEQELLQFMKERVYAAKPQEQEIYAMCTHLSLDVCACNTTEAYVPAMAYTKTNVCLHLSLDGCSCITTKMQDSGSSTKKRKLGDKATIGARKKACHTVERRWGYSTELMLNDDPWKIKKVLKESDIGNMSRLMIGRELVEDLVLPVLGADVDLGKGIQVRIWDVDTNSMHSLVFKRWVSSRSYIFIGKWVQDFVIRRGLKEGDEIAFHWDPYNNLFNFSVLLQAN